ncbi:MAG: CPBP family intramembrane metalloprotease [Acidobacteriia bacterium]|nr:CPBP family intramembrane metalloprotease [Terriglobia bacterium]
MDNEFPYITPPPPLAQPGEPQPPASQTETHSEPQAEPHPEPERPPLVAPLWHTLIIVAAILLNSYFSGSKIAGTQQQQHRPFLYLSSIVLDILVFLFLWIGLRLRKFSMRELIGGQRDRFKTFLAGIGVPSGFWMATISLLIEIGVTALFWIVSTSALGGLKYALGLAGKDPKVAMDAVKQSMGAVLPHTGPELALFVCLALTAGIFEEILFRGYLQKQLGSLTGNAWVGLVISAVIFGAAHGYQGARFMVLIAIYGMMFGLLAHFWKGLRPGMMAHAFQDAFSGIAFFILTKYKLI